MMNIMIKTLNGDLTTVVVPNEFDVPLFKTILYRDVLPTAPYGCLTLRRILAELEEDADETMQLMVMGESLTDHVSDPHEVAYLCDTMILSAFVDTTLLYPTVDRWFALDVGSRTDSWMKTFDVYHVFYHSKVEMVTEESNVVSTVALVHDVDNDRWALRSSFAPEGYRYSKGQLLEYPSPDIRWYSHPTICLRNAPDRVPKDDATLSAIQRIFDQEDWNTQAPVDDDEDEFDDADEPDHDWYEENMRWEH
jgi:hypothetical protein